MLVGKEGGEIIRYSPYKPPREKHGEGSWVAVAWHAEKGYPLRWHWVPEADLDTPPEVPGDSTLLTKEELEKKVAEKMERDFKEAGYPTKGSQPKSDFEPDE